MRMLWILPAALLATPTVGYAGPVVYHYKAGVAPEQFQEDQEACLELARPTTLPRSPRPSSSPIPSNPQLNGMQSGVAQGVATGLASIQNSIQKNAMRRDAFDMCMSVKGYSLRKLSAAEKQKLDALGAEERALRLAELAADPDSPHPVVRTR